MYVIVFNKFLTFSFDVSWKLLFFCFCDHGSKHDGDSCTTFEQCWYLLLSPFKKKKFNSNTNLITEHTERIRKIIFFFRSYS